MHYTHTFGDGGGKGLKFRMGGENMTPQRLRQTEEGKWGIDYFVIWVGIRRVEKEEEGSKETVND